MSGCLILEIVPVQNFNICAYFVQSNIMFDVTMTGISLWVN